MNTEKNDIINSLKQSILKYDPESAKHWAHRIVELGVDPLNTANQLIEVIRKVGKDFSEGLIFLPELVAAGAAMQGAMEIIQEEITRRGQRRESKGRVLIGTVVGDVHDIGKNMVTAFTRAAGFEVIDLGVNIRAEAFVDAVKRHEPDILALSALMTTTIMEQKKVIESLKAFGLRDRVKIMVGGAAVTQEFADRIGADGYESTAVRAAELALRFMSR
jgi:corrinoid protein of di/trimethylamine methyltransferase